VSPAKVRITRLGPAYDLLAAYHPAGVFMEREGIGVAGGASGGFAMAIAGLQAGLRAPGPAAGPADLFGWIEGIGGDGGAPPPIVFGSVPFDPNRVGWFQIPRSVVRRDREGETWAIDIDPRDRTTPGAADRFVGRAMPHEPFSGMQIRPEPLPDAYERAVAVAVERIRAGELRKVVLARTIELVAGRELDPRQLLWRLRAAEPHGYAFAVPVDSGAAVMVGASPELLVSRFGREVRANPLAGSAPRFGDAAEDRASAERLRDSTKDAEEHRIVVEAIAATLDPVCESLTWDPQPVLLETANVWHLSTRFHGTLRDPAPHALELVRLLHPTPAVCGDPRDAAMSLIRSLEPVPRGAYAGAVGWMDANGDGIWAIALRCARLKGDAARLFAGAGIVADSDPAAELDETERKFRAFLDSLRWG
jgi:isochorismate synthase